MPQTINKAASGGEELTEWVEDGTLWLRPAPDESVADFVKRAARARGPLTDSEKIALRDIFTPVLDQLSNDAADTGSALA